MNKEFAIFANSINDTKGFYQLVDKLSAINKNLYHNTSGTIVTKSKTLLGPNLEIIFGYLEKQGLEPEGDLAQKKFVEEIIKELKAVPQVRVTLAFEPDDAFTAKLNEEISNQAGQKVILDFLINHHIVAGVVVEYKGKIRDYSLETKVDEYLKETVGKEVKESAH